MGILALIAACSLFLRRWRYPARGPPLVDLVRGPGGRRAVGHGGRHPVRPPHVRHPRHQRRAPHQPEPAPGRLGPGRPVWPGGSTCCSRTGPPDPAPPTAPPRRRSRWRRGRRAETVVTCVPAGRHGGAGRLLVGRRTPASDGHGHPVPHEQRGPDAGGRGGHGPGGGGGRGHLGRPGRASPLHRTWSACSRAALAVDLVVFNVMIIQPPITEAHAKAARGRRRPPSGRCVGDGRFIIYDPDRLYGNQLLSLGQTDLNIYSRLPSAQGYTALTDGGYFAATGAHYQEDLNPETLAGTVWDGLNVTTLVSVPGLLRDPGPLGTAAARTRTRNPAAPERPRPATGPARRRSPTPSTLAPGAVRPLVLRWGADRRVLAGPRAGRRSATFRVGLVTTTGGLRWLPRPADATVTGTGSGRTLRVTMAQTDPGRRDRRGQPARSSRTVVGVPEADTVRGRGGGPRRPDAVLGRLAATGGSPGCSARSGSSTTPSRRGGPASPAPGVGRRRGGSSVTAPAPGGRRGSTVSVRATASAVLVRSVAWSPRLAGHRPDGAATWAAAPCSGRRPGGAGHPGRGAPAGAPSRRPGATGSTFAYRPARPGSDILVSGAGRRGPAGWAWPTWSSLRRRRRLAGEVGGTRVLSASPAPAARWPRRPARRWPRPPCGPCRPRRPAAR